MNCIRLLQLAERQSKIFFKITSVRYSSQHPVRFMETQNMWREKDEVSKRWQLIYKAPMGTALNFASTYLTVTTGIVGISGIYYGSFMYNIEDFNKPIVIGDDIIIANNAAEGLVYLGAFIALHIAVKLILSKYVMRIYQDGDEYIAVYRGHFFNYITKHKFHLKDFKKVNALSILPWSESRYSLGKRQGIIMENYFKTPEYYNYLLTKNSRDKEEEKE